MEMWIFVPISAFAAVAWVIYIVVDGFRRRQQIRLATEFHGKLLDRIGSAKEFGEFLNTAGGGKFLDTLTLERDSGPHLRILKALQSGLVFLSLGLGLFLLIGVTDISEGSGSTPAGRAAEEGLAVLATLATSVGVGLLLSAGASFGLSKRLGLFNGESDRRIVDSAHTA